LTSPPEGEILSADETVAENQGNDVYYDSNARERLVISKPLGWGLN